MSEECTEAQIYGAPSRLWSDPSIAREAAARRADASQCSDPADDAAWLAQVWGGLTGARRAEGTSGVYPSEPPQDVEPEAVPTEANLTGWFDEVSNQCGTDYRTRVEARTVGALLALWNADDVPADAVAA